MKGSLYTEELKDYFVSKGFWTPDSLADTCDRMAKDYPDKEAIIDSNMRVTWAEFKTLSDRLALGFLELGIRRDQMVAAQLPNMVEAYLLFIAFRKAGMISAFPPTTYRHMELEHILGSLEAVAVVIPPKYRDFDYFQMVEETRPKAPNLKHVFVVGDDVPPGTISINEMMKNPLETKYPADYLDKFKGNTFDISTILPTTGTTGLPKFVEVPEASLRTAGEAVIRQLSATKDDVFGGLAPISGAPGRLTAQVVLQLGAKTVLLDKPRDNEDILRRIGKEKITVLMAVPAMIFRLLDDPNLDKYDLSLLRVVRTGGAPVPVEEAMKIEEKFGVKIAISSGSSETGGFGYATVDDPPEIRLKTLGKPPYATEVRIADDNGKELPLGEIGELQGRGGEQCMGYYENKEATDEAWGGQVGKDAWYRTGDLAKIDSGGNLIIMGRKKDMILRGSQNLFPKEIEDLLREHPKIKDVAIVAMPDPIMSEKACACVIPQSGETFTFDEMTSFLNEKKLAPFKIPERLEIYDVFPVVADVQKLDKKALRVDVAKKLEAEAKK